MVIQGPTRRGFLLSAAAVALPGSADQTDRQVARAASFLLETYETVFCARATVLPGRRWLRELVRSPLGDPYAELFAGLSAAGADPSALVDGATLLVGAKDFRLPMGLGSGRFTFCHIMVLSDIGRLADLSKKLSSAGAAQMRARREWQWPFRVNSEAGASAMTMFARGVDDHSLVLSNDLGELGAASASLSRADTTRIEGQPDGCPFMGASYWGRRRAKRGSGALDIEELAHLSPPITEVVLYRRDAQACVLCLVASESLGEKRRTGQIIWGFPAFGAKGRTWQALLPLGTGENTIERLFSVMSMFGFGMAV